MLTLNIKRLYAKLFLGSASFQTSWKKFGETSFQGKYDWKLQQEEIPSIIPSEWNCMLNERRIKNSLWTFIVWRWILKSSLSSGRVKKREKNFVNEANWNGRNWKIWTKHENAMMRVGWKRRAKKGTRKFIRISVAKWNVTWEEIKKWRRKIGSGKAGTLMIWCWNV